MESVTYSIFGIIVELAEMKDVIKVMILSIFSVVFPVGKLCVFCALFLFTQDPKAFLFITEETLGKFSMAEVFVLSFF